MMNELFNHSCALASEVRHRAASETTSPRLTIWDLGRAQQPSPHDLESITLNQQSALTVSAVVI